MYKDYFGFKEYPFNVTADSSFFYSSQSHSQAFSHLEFGINERKGIIAITGEVGTGKTTLCRTLINQLGNQVHTALILNPKFSDTQLIKMILHDLGVHKKTNNKFLLVNTLNEFLLEESRKGFNVAIIVDEAQNLSASQLESIRLLSNIETEKEKLLQIVLFGQPELCQKLKMPALRQLNQRISVRFHVQPLNREEVLSYIKHRMHLASVDTDQKHYPQFSESSLDTLYHYTQGTPRMINLLCDRALLASFANNRYHVDNEVIQQCAKELYLS